jgi:hypothetical protein
VVWALARSKEVFELFRFGGAKFTERPSSEVAGVADGSADQEALGIDSVAEESERGFGVRAFLHDA